MFPEFATHVGKRTRPLKLQMKSPTSGVRPPTTIQDKLRFRSEFFFMQKTLDIQNESVYIIRVVSKKVKDRH